MGCVDSMRRKLRFGIASVEARPRKGSGFELRSRCVPDAVAPVRGLNSVLGKLVTSSRQSTPGQETHDEPQAKSQADGLVRALFNSLVRGLSACPRALFYRRHSGPEQLLAIMDDNFDIIQKLFQIHVIPNFRLLAHSVNIFITCVKVNGVFTLYTDIASRAVGNLSIGSTCTLSSQADRGD